MLSAYLSRHRRDLTTAMFETLFGKTGDQSGLVALLSAPRVGFMITTFGSEQSGPSIRYVNDAMIQICGYDANEMIGQSPKMLQGSNTDLAAAKRFREDIQAGGGAFMKTTNYKKNGTQYEVAVIGGVLNPKRFSEHSFLMACQCELPN